MFKSINGTFRRVTDKIAIEHFERKWERSKIKN